MERIILGVGAVVLYRDGILLVKRGKDPCRGCWAVPGGRVEYGESLYDAVIRELREETGISGEPLGVVWVDELLPGRGCNEHYVLVDILVKPLSTDIRAGSDAVKARFYPLNNLPDNVTSTTMRLIEHIKYMLSKYGRIIVIPAMKNEQIIRDSFIV